jgi:hypothetical protein
VTAEARTVSVTIERPPTDVYEYIRDERNLPAWTFFEAVTRHGDGWAARVGDDTYPLAFVPRNDLGVLDHVVIQPSGAEFTMPLRVIANGAGSEVMLTVFRRDGVDFDDDVAAVQKDFAVLKGLLES